MKSRSDLTALIPEGAITLTKQPRRILAMFFCSVPDICESADIPFLKHWSSYLKGRLCMH